VGGGDDAPEQPPEPAAPREPVVTSAPTAPREPVVASAPAAPAPPPPSYDGPPSVAPPGFG
jgi:hypothetical protein